MRNLSYKRRCEELERLYENSKQRMLQERWIRLQVEQEARYLRIQLEEAKNQLEKLLLLDGKGA